MKTQRPQQFRQLEACGLSAVDWLLILLVCVLSIALCVVRSRGRLLWSDELFSWNLLNDPSFRHMMAGWNLGADSGGVMYYLLARPWVSVVGLSELNLRLFSTIGMMVAVVFVWISGRRYYSTPAVAFGVALVFFTIPAILWQDVTGRFYGLLLGSVAFASLMFLRTADKADLPWTDLLATALASALVCGSHILGIVYSASLLLAAIALDRVRGRWRPGLYLATIAGWLVLPLSYHAIVATTSVTSTAFWTQKPTWGTLLFATVGYSKPIRDVVVVLGLFVVSGRFFRNRRTTFSAESSDRMSVYALAAGLFFAVLILFVKSRLEGVSIFADRYLLPLSLATALILADLVTRVLPTQRRYPKSIAAAATLFIAVCAVYAFTHPFYAATFPTIGLPQRIEARLPPDHTVVVRGLPLYLFLTHYDKTHRYIYLIDWKYDLAPQRAGAAHGAERVLENTDRAGYYNHTIQTCDQIMQQNPSFTFLMLGTDEGWVRTRLLVPSYQTESLGSFTEWFPFTIWHTERIGPVLPCR